MVIAVKAFSGGSWIIPAFNRMNKGTALNWLKMASTPKPTAIGLSRKLALVSQNFDFIRVGVYSSSAAITSTLLAALLAPRAGGHVGAAGISSAPAAAHACSKSASRMNSLVLRGTRLMHPLRRFAFANTARKLRDAKKMRARVPLGVGSSADHRDRNWQRPQQQQVKPTSSLSFRP